MSLCVHRSGWQSNLSGKSSSRRSRLFTHTLFSWFSLYFLSVCFFYSLILSARLRFFLLTVIPLHCRVCSLRSSAVERFLDPLLGNVISWIITVLFAFYTNRIRVFQAPTSTKKEFFQQLASFFSGRIVTLLIEELLLGIFITWLQFPEIPVKVVAQVVVIVLNYVISKLFIFHSK